jgi:uncharacterized protein (DUF305 family)
MNRQSIFVLFCICAVGAAAVVAQDAHDQHEHHVDDHGNEAAVQRAPLYTHDDLMFLQHMIVHHQQALDMSALVPDRTDRPAFMRFARYIAGAQAAEIAEMQELLHLAAERGIELPAHDHLHGDPPMAGMLSAAQVRALADATGAAFERLWLEGMIYHHQGAIDMASAQQLRQLDEGRRPFGLDVLVEEMLLEQRAEIHRMQRWLQEWGLADTSDSD